MAKKMTNRAQSNRAAEPIRDPEDIKRIRAALQKGPRDLLLFDLSIQTGLKMRELLTLKVKDLLGLEVGDKLPLATSSAMVHHSIVMSDVIHQTFQKYLKNVRPGPEDYLFKSRKGPSPLNLSSVSHMIKGWFRQANVKGRYGTISLRKTWEHSAGTPSHGKVGTARAGTAQQLDPVETLNPIETLTVQEKIYNSLFEGIISGSIPPGSKLNAGNIANRFNVSLMPVRVALTKLEERGFVITRKKRASVVKELSIDNLKEMMAIRLALETFGAKLSCKIRTEETLKLLEAMIPVYAHTTDRKEFILVNKEFHRTLLRDADMPMLQALIVDFCDRVSPYFIQHVTDLEQKHSLECHQGILEGMRQKSQKEVCKWLARDLAIGTERLQKAWELTIAHRTEH